MKPKNGKNRYISFKYHFLLTKLFNRIPEIVERARKLKVNGGMEAGADVGPVVSKRAKERVEKLIQSGVDQGANLVLDGRGVSVPGYEKGNFIGPTILTDVTPDMECYKEEIFGPVLVCVNADTLDDAIQVSYSNILL